MELTIQHLAPYIPYGLKVLSKRHFITYGEETIMSVNGLAFQDTGQPPYWQYEFLHEDDLKFADINEKGFRPILKKLDLYSLILNKFAENTDAEFMGWFNDDIVDLDLIDELSVFNLPFGGVQWLIKNHYDVFGLIELGLAIDPDYNW